MNTHTPLTPELRNQLRSLAAHIATSVGDEVLDLRRGGASVADTKSSETDVVTEADREAEERIVQAITAERPLDGIFAEEGHARASETGITWVIDPIDGTVNYLYDLPAYCVSIAATVEDSDAYADGRRSVAAAVYNPRTGELFSAAEGFGATRNGETIQVSAPATLAECLVATGFGYTRERRLEQARILTSIIPHIRDIRRFGSAAYDLCMLASGTLDAYYEIGIQPWDWAAAALIATEAGAVTLGQPGKLPGSQLFVAAPAHIATEIQTITSKQ